LNIKGNKLVLNSERQPKYRNDDYLITKILAKSDTQTMIFIQSKYDEPLPFIKCVSMRNGTAIESMSDLEGKVKFNFQPIESIEISFPGFKTAHFTNKDASHHDYIITLKDQDDYYRYFTNEELTIKRKRLYCDKTKRTKKKYTIYRISNFYEKMDE
jgi:hypothetical protein